MSDGMPMKKKTAINGQKPLYKSWLFWVIIPAVIFSVIAAVLLTYSLIRVFVDNIPKAQKAKVELEPEFQAIAPLPDAKEVRYTTSFEIDGALVDSTYITNLSFDEIIRYYDAQLIQNGWKYIETRDLKDWGRDFGGKTATYCKGDYQASIQYAGETANYGWTYAFSLSLNSSECEEEE